MQSHNLKADTKILLHDGFGKVKRVIELKAKRPNTALVEVQHLSKSGIIKDEFSFPMKSYVKNFLANINSAFRYTGYGIKNTGNGNFNIMAEYEMTGASMLPYAGVILGTSNTAVNVETDYTMASRIMIGTGTGQLSRGNVSVGVPQKIGSAYYKIPIYTTYTNNSGSAITVRECGLTALGSSETSVVLFARDILNKDGIPISVTMQNGDSFRFTYNMLFDFSEGFTKAFCYQFYNGAIDTYMGSSVGALSCLDILGNSNFAGAYENNANQSVSVNSTVGTTWTALPSYQGYGLRIGTSNTAPTIDDYTLGGLIEEGTGTGQVLHSAMSFGAIAVVDGILQFNVERTFSNNSGADIDVGCYGLFTRNYTAYEAFNNRRKLILKKLTGALPIANGEAITIIQSIGINT